MHGCDQMVERILSSDVASRSGRCKRVQLSCLVNEFLGKSLHLDTACLLLLKSSVMRWTAMTWGFGPERKAVGKASNSLARFAGSGHMQLPDATGA